MHRVTDAHRQARRRQILDAAVECFAREGFHRTTMAEIIAESGMSTGAIYLYFPGKDDIVEAIAEERHAVETSIVTAALGNPDTRAALHDLAGAYFEWLSEPGEQPRRRVLVQVWAEALRNERVALTIQAGVDQRRPLAAFLHDRQLLGHINPAPDPDALSRAMLSLILGFVLQQAWDPAIDLNAYRAVLDAMIDDFVVVDAAEGTFRGDRSKPPAPTSS